MSDPRLPPVRPSGLCSACFWPRIVGRPLLYSGPRCTCPAEPLEGGNLARHLGFGDGLRIALGKMPVDLENPVSLQFPVAYFEGLGQGKTAVVLRKPTLWDTFKSFFRRGH